MKSLEKKEQSAKSEQFTKIPDILDIVCVDGQWMQVSGGGALVRNLDTGSTCPIVWEDYRRTQRFVNQAVVDFPALLDDPQKMQNIIWQDKDDIGTDRNEKKFVTVFGIYEKK